jgi:hypothetical protein
LPRSGISREQQPNEEDPAPPPTAAAGRLNLGLGEYRHHRIMSPDRGYRVSLHLPIVSSEFAVASVRRECLEPLSEEVTSFA